MKGWGVSNCFVGASTCIPFVILLVAATAVADSVEQVDLVRLAKLWSGPSEPFRLKVQSEIVCMSNVPVSMARFVLTNQTVDPTNRDLETHLTLAAAARCAAVVPRGEWPKPKEAQGQYAPTVCHVLGRVPVRWAECESFLEECAASKSSASRIAARVALGSLRRDAEGQEQYLLKALREDAAVRAEVIESLEKCGSSDWISVRLAGELVRLASEDGDRLITVSAIVGAMGPRALPVADSLERAWQREKTTTGPIANRDMVVRTAVAKLRGQWNEGTARAVLADAGDYDVFDGTTIATVDLVCYRMLDDKDLKPIFSLVEDKDRRVLLGAARFCTILGAKARNAAPALFQALEAGTESKVREEIVSAIALVGTRETAQRLRKLAAAASEDERKVFGDWARVIVATGDALGPLFP